MRFRLGLLVPLLLTVPGSSEAQAPTPPALVPANAITINGVSSREASGSAIGYHVGADFTYFVHRFVGFAGGVRFGEALVEATEPLSGLTQQFRVGSTTAFLGLRFRLGRAHLNR